MQGEPREDARSSGLSGFLRAESSGLVRAWQAAIDAHLGGVDLGEAPLQGHGAELLRTVADVLDGLLPEGAVAAVASRQTRLGEGAGCELRRAVNELQLLRQVVLDSPWAETTAANAFHRLLDQAIAVAVERFTLGRDPPNHAAGEAELRPRQDAEQRNEVLRVTTERLRAILDTTVEGIITIDEHGTMQSVNAATARIFGYSEAELLGRNVSMLMPEPDRGAHDGYMEAYLRTGERKVIGIGREVTGLRKDGSVFPLELSVGESRLPRTRLFTGVVRDISARKQAEADRDETLALLETVLATAPVGLSFVDRELRYLRINDALSRITGVPVAEALGRPLHEVNPELFPHVEPYYRHVLERGEPVSNVEMTGVPSDRAGPQGHFLVSYYPVKDGQGRVLLIGAVVVDITERKRAEEVTAQMNALVEAAPAGVALLDTDLRYVRINGALARSNGLPAEAHIGRTVAEIVPERVAELEPLLRRVLETGRSTQRLEFTAHPADDPGRLHHLTADFFPVLGADGRTTGVGGIIHDVTEQVNLTRALAQALAERERIADVFEHGEACFVLDRDFRIVLVNRNQEKLSHTTRQETLGRSFWEVFPATAHPDSPYWEVYHRVMRDRVPASFQAYYEPLQLWTDVRAYPTRDGGIAVFFFDSTNRKRLEQFQERLAGIVGHDLRGPLSTISLSAKLLLQRELPDLARPAARRISTSADRMARMIEELLDFTRARLGGGLSIQRRPVDLTDIVRATLEEFEVTHPGRVRLQADVGPVRGSFDEDRLMQVVSNLISNALAHGAHDKRVAVDVRSSDECALVTVENQGAPIAPELLPHIFDPFRRADQAATGRIGLGLGLYIVQEIVVAHGGRIEVSSNDDRTTFTVSLPRT